MLTISKRCDRHRSDPVDRLEDHGSRLDRSRKIFTRSITLQGDDILLAALDIVGIVDPTGIADALSASLYAQQGDLVNAMVSGVGLILTWVILPRY